MILMWDAPKKVRTPQQNAENYGFEEGPTGGYQPNMSDADAQRWKAKITGQKRGIPQVEVRKTIRGTMLTIIVCLEGGYTYKYYGPGLRTGLNTDGIQIHMSANGPIQMSFGEMEEMQLAISEARAKLQEMANV